MQKSPKNVIITGANRGIGLALTIQFAKAGYHVLATARKPLQAVKLIELADTDEHNISIFKVDVTNKMSVNNFAKTIIGMPIDILINNAGILDTYNSSIDDIDLVSFAEVLTVNTLSPIRLMRAVMPNLRLGNTKKVANISSFMGSFEGTSTGAHAYRTSKAALNRSMQIFGLELADEGFTVMNLHPGWVQTDMGGPQADIDVTTSATGLLKVIETTKAADAKHIIGYNGKTLSY
ncbi:MAG: SDR family oxidoreductase [Rhizobiales bacterium]|nr:SDR family oxidoreductase [Hyphomicrobiales bacterium]NRB14009.1 SDR family oxidoreductase [Hyphomicrobiales bacterium]